ncbi:hypothetical protein L6R50_02620 [Myxococcota bacterium]|nr:hypothetical protein [Myxococcota bacterium]
MRPRGAAAALLGLALLGAACAGPGATVKVGAGRLRFVLRDAEARGPAVSGSWDGWAAHPMAAVRPGVYRLDLEVPPGIHRCAVRAGIDRWLAPRGAGARVVPDGWGGENARVEVPAGGRR